MRTTRLAVIAVLLALVGPAIGLAAPAVAFAAPADTPPAYLRLAHLSPDTPTVDVYVDSAGDPSRSFVVHGVGYGAVSQYQPLPPDSYVISMRPAGADAATPPVISTSVDARPGAAYTVAGTGKSANLGLSVLNDKLDIPPAGKASVRVINAALSVPSADVGPVNGPVWAEGRGVRHGDRLRRLPPREVGPRSELVRDVDDGAAHAGGELDLQRAADRQG